MNALFSVRDVEKRFADGRRAVDGVSLDVGAGEVVALVGESGSGKSTLARLVCGLLPADSGRILVAGERLRRAGTRVQMVFQDPFASLNPVHTVEHHLRRPVAQRLGGSRASLHTEVVRLLAAVGLESNLAARHPHALSGGQRQRVAVARALATEPEVIVADEPTSMLDVSTRLGVLTLLRKLADERRLAILLITHDLASAAAIADRVLTMYAGRVVEAGASATVLTAPAHPYTRLLLSCAPRGEPLLPSSSSSSSPSSSSSSSPSSSPSSLAPPPSHAGRGGGPGCAFAPRCPYVMSQCHDTSPPDHRIASDHQARCHLFEEGASEHATLS